MVWVILILVLIVGLFIGYLIWITSEPDAPPLDVDPEQAIKAAIELHKIRSRLDVAWTKSEQRREGAHLRREISEALKSDEDD